MVQPGVPLSTWIRSWSAVTTTSSADESAGRRAKGNLSAVLSVLTAPTRTGLAAESSPLNLAVGSLSCVAEDTR
jgi:hypothetical protein